jgi:hypothetical protein
MQFFRLGSFGLRTGPVVGGSCFKARVSLRLRLPQGVLRFRTVGNRSSERRVGRILHPEHPKVKRNLDLFPIRNKTGQRREGLFVRKSRIGSRPYQCVSIHWKSADRRVGAFGSSVLSGYSRRLPFLVNTLPGRGERQILFSCESKQAGILVAIVRGCLRLVA